jgi:hypothetical protein
MPLTYVNLDPRQSIKFAISELASAARRLAEKTANNALRDNISVLAQED